MKNELAIWISNLQMCCWVLTWNQKSQILVYPGYLMEISPQYSLWTCLEPRKLYLPLVCVLNFVNYAMKFISLKPCFISCRGYIAPELIDKQKISLKSDIFSLGIIIERLLTGIYENITETVSVIFLIFPVPSDTIIIYSTIYIAFMQVHYPHEKSYNWGRRSVESYKF